MFVLSCRMNPVVFKGMNPAMETVEGRPHSKPERIVSPSACGKLYFRFKLLHWTGRTEDRVCSGSGCRQQQALLSGRAGQRPPTKRNPIQHSPLIQSFKPGLYWRHSVHGRRQTVCDCRSCRRDTTGGQKMSPGVGSTSHGPVACRHGKENEKWMHCTMSNSMLTGSVQTSWHATWSLSPLFFLCVSVCDTRERQREREREREERERKRKRERWIRKKGTRQAMQTDTRSGVATDFRVGGPETQGAKPRVPPNPVFSPDFGHLFFSTALTP